MDQRRDEVEALRAKEIEGVKTRVYRATATRISRLKKQLGLTGDRLVEMKELISNKFRPRQDEQIEQINTQCDKLLKFPSRPIPEQIIKSGKRIKSKWVRLDSTVVSRKRGRNYSSEVESDSNNTDSGSDDDDGNYWARVREEEERAEEERKRQKLEEEMVAEEERKQRQLEEERLEMERQRRRKMGYEIWMWLSDGWYSLETEDSRPVLEDLGDLNEWKNILGDNHLLFSDLEWFQDQDDEWVPLGEDVFPNVKLSKVGGFKRPVIIKMATTMFTSEASTSTDDLETKVTCEMGTSTDAEQVIYYEEGDYVPNSSIVNDDENNEYDGNDWDDYAQAISTFC